eukprot:gnl/MRDRNA2_/MRDRNA2_178740_c0_seq1.p1 gnl/MRDRNA2_/MRDRNA2_178740_c0~~gnl/MRDRNA2_/MRDRNA2_178740_c0_seq1.p1  ORF type:complete len:194 (+),score=34.87 gnl/MRDRNA2_/MRDRNA2_178740_c0_seq1:214-795(+)
MRLSNLKPAEGSTKSGKRVGRGQGSGKGGTATRGHKGQKSRSGYSKKIGFEGGQMPLQRRVPKFGFKNINRVEYRGINLDMIQALVDRKKVKEITPAILVEGGLAHKNDLVKILGRGELTAKLNVTAHAFSKSALAAIEAAGGKTIALTIKKEEEAPAKEKAPKAKKEKAPVEAKEEVVEEAVAEEANEENEA